MKKRVYLCITVLFFLVWSCAICLPFYATFTQPLPSATTTTSTTSGPSSPSSPCRTWTRTTLIILNTLSYTFMISVCVHALYI